MSWIILITKWEIPFIFVKFSEDIKMEFNLEGKEDEVNTESSNSILKEEEFFEVPRDFLIYLQNTDYFDKNA